MSFKILTEKILMTISLIADAKKQSDSIKLNCKKPHSIESGDNSFSNGMEDGE